MYRGNGLNDFGDEFSQFKGVMAPVDAAAEDAALREVWPSAAPKASPAKRAHNKRIFFWLAGARSLTRQGPRYRGAVCLVVCLAS